MPYRDFWTMYSPGSFYVVAAVFAVLGKHLLLSNALGVVTAAASVAAFHRFASIALGVRRAAAATAMYVVGYYATAYHRGFQSYPPAILLVWLAASQVVLFTQDGARRRLVFAGLALGLSSVFKHDIAVYAWIAGAVTIVTGAVPRGVSKAKSVALFGACAAAVAVPVYGALAAVAGEDMWRDLVVFPLTDFKFARAQGFPEWLPPIRGLPGLGAVRDLAEWCRFAFPLLFCALALVAVWFRRRTFEAPARAVLVLVGVAFPFYAHAASVQLNTHLITLTGFAALLGAAVVLTPERGAGARAATLAVVALWCGALFTEPAFQQWRRQGEGTEAIGVAGLEGIRATHTDAAWMRDLSAAIAAGGPPGAPLLMLATRNDILVYAAGVPYWLTDRPFVTRHEELHPAITDTEPVQRRMLADIARGPLPVVVREHRFPGDSLDETKAQFLAWGLPVGATLLDAWVAEHFTPGPLFGMYEVMRRR